MFPTLHKKLFIFTPSLASAFPQASSTATSPAPSATQAASATQTASAAQTSSALSLPTNLQAVVPACAWSCFESVLFDEWPLGCASSGDLECLCSKYSTTGLTLGEAAYGCTFTSCSSSVSGFASTYSICSGQDGAVAATHSTLTFTAHSTSTADTTASAASSTPISSSSLTNTTSTPSSSTTSSSSRTSSRTTLDTSTSATSAAASSAAAASSTAAQSSASSSATAAAATSASGHGSGLSTPQIVGISVASVSAVVLAVGVLFSLACLRKRDRKKELGEEESEKQARSKFALTPPSHDDVAMSPSALAQFPSPPRNRRDPRNGAGVGTGGTAIPQVRIVDPSPPRHRRAPTPLESIGLAITEDSPVASPASFSSSRTVSQLLPDKPEPVHPRKPQPAPTSPVPTSAPFIEKRKKPSQRDSSMSQGTVFEEDTAVRKSMYPVRAVQVPPRQDAPAKVPPVRPYRPPPSFAPEYTASPAEDKARQPSLSLTIPPSGRPYPRQPTPSPPPIPSPLRIGVARPPNVAKPPLPLYQLPAALPAMLPSGPHSSASSGSTKFTGTNSTASSSYIPAYYTSPPTSIMQTPPESYGNAAGGFSGPQRPPDAGAPPVLLGHSSPSSRSSPQRHAQASAVAPPPMQTRMHQTPPAAAAVQNRAMPPQPALAHSPGETTGQQASAPLQGSHANPPALRQPSPPSGQPVPAAGRHHNHQQEQDQQNRRPSPSFPTSANQRSGPPPPGSSSSAPLASSTQPASQYRPYNASYARPPLPPQPRSPPRPAARPPLVKGRTQRSTSSASMTSFESASLPGDPSPPTEDDDNTAKQLGAGKGADGTASAAASGRHPHAIDTASSSTLRATTTPPQQHGDGSAEGKSPISDIKYPKVPRASNQAVPRTSPNAGSHRTGTPSPRVQQHGAGADNASDASPKGGGALQARRRGGREGTGGLLIIDSGANNDGGPSSSDDGKHNVGGGRRVTPTKKKAASGGRSPHTPQGQIISAPGGGATDAADHDPDQARKSSAALPNHHNANWPIVGAEGGGHGDVAIKTPMWAPRLTPTRRGDDMYLAVAYASKEGSNSR